MKSTSYFAFSFRHTINLEEYLKKNYQLDFISTKSKKICVQDPDLQLGVAMEFENTWVRPNSSSLLKGAYGIQRRQGNVLTWEALENNCSLTEAIALVKLKSQDLATYKSQYLIKLESIAGLVMKRMTIGRPSQVMDFLDSRGIDYPELDNHFDIGSPGTYQSLLHFFASTPYSKDQIRSLFWDLFIARRAGDMKYLPFKPCVTVPVFGDTGIFIGFHGRFINPTARTKYFNTGYLHQVVTEVIYAEEKASIQSAIQSKRQIIITKGIFDFFTCYQNGYQQVVATLNQGISYQQFERVLKYPVHEIVVGFTAAKERDTILGLMTQSLSKIDLSLISQAQDIDDAVIAGSCLSDIIASAVSNMQATEDGRIAASLKKKKAGMEALTELGQTFLIKETALKSLINTSKKSPRKMKNFLVNEGITGKAVVQRVGYIRFPKTFVTDTILGGFGAELRTLLHLLLKTKGRQIPINYTQSSLRGDLGLSQAVLIGHLNKLKQSGYLIWKRDIRIEQLKTKQRRIVAFYYYPSTIKYG